MAEPPRRVNFVDGLLLTAADLAAEQEYHRDLRHLHNRLHGYGTVSGLEVTTTGARVRVSPGTGIDGLGRDIRLTSPRTLRLRPPAAARRWVRDLAIRWREVPESPVPGPDGDVHVTRWVEEPEVSLAAQGAAAPEALLLARLTRTVSGEIEVDTSVRRPLAPP